MLIVAKLLVLVPELANTKPRFAASVSNRGVATSLINYDEAVILPTDGLLLEICDNDLPMGA